MVVAVIMAGGKGTRLRSNQEKPLLKVRGQPLIESVVNALLSSKKVETILVATSVHSPQTAQWAKNKKLTNIDTPGRGYVEDMAFILSSPELLDKIILTVAADLPFSLGR